jgi:hypothetical protein
VVSPSNTTTYYGRWENSAEIQRQTVTVNVSSLTTSVIIEASTPLTVCNGTSVTYKAIPTNGGSSPTYQWKVNGTNVGTNSQTYTYVPLNGDQVSVV